MSEFFEADGLEGGAGGGRRRPASEPKALTGSSLRRELAVYFGAQAAVEEAADRMQVSDQKLGMSKELLLPVAHALLIERYPEVARVRGLPILSFVHGRDGYEVRVARGNKTMVAPLELVEARLAPATRKSKRPPSKRRRSTSR